MVEDMAERDERVEMMGISENEEYKRNGAQAKISGE